MKNAVALTTITIIIATMFFAGRTIFNARLCRDISTTPPNKRAAKIGANHDFVCAHVRAGMTKEQVRKIIGSPQNADNEHVWAWAYDCEEHPVDTNSWMKMGWNGTMYVIFLDGRVSSDSLAVRASAAETPMELVMSVKGCDKRTALAMLGVAPDEIDRYFKESALWEEAWKKMRSGQNPPDTQGSGQ